MPEFPELPHVHHLAGEAEEKEGERFSRIVVVAIVLATLGAALTAYAQASSLSARDRATAEATTLATRSLAARGLSDQASQLQIERFDLAREQRTRAADAEQQAFSAPAAERPALDAERRRWSAVAEDTERNTRRIAAAYGLTPVEPDSREGPALDSAFPQRYLAASRERAYELTAEREVANEQADQHDGQVGRYSLSLTLFAVAVFLFGYSLTPHAQRRRGLFAGVASAFAIAGGIWTAVTAASPAERPPERAAVAFAEGRVAYDSQEYEESVRALNTALRLWPDSAQAHAVRALSEIAAGSPQLDVPISLTTAPALSAAVNDLQAALDLGVEDSQVVLQHGFDLFSLGLKRDDDATIEEGLRYSEQAAEERPGDPVPEFNVAVADLALGRIAASRRAYDEAVQRTVFSDLRRHVRRNDVNAYEFYLAEALTDLDSVRTARGARLGGAVDEAKRAIVGPITRAADAEPLAPRGRQDARAEGISLTIGPAYAGFHIARSRGITPDADISTQWYFSAPRGLGWGVLADLSGATIGDIEEVGDGQFDETEPFLAKGGSCLSPGPYRLEVYVNGRLAGVGTGTGAFPELRSTRSPDLGVAFCRPPAWRPVAGRRPGLVDGYASPDGRSGIVLVSLNRELIGAGRPSARVSRGIIAEALRRFSGMLPARVRGGADTSRTFPVAPDGAIVRRYTYPGGRLLAGAGATRSGELLVALAYGPKGSFSALADPVFSSVSQAR